MSFYLLGKGIYWKRFLLSSLSAVLPPGEDQGEFPGILQAKRRGFVMSSLICLLVKRIYWKILLLSSLGPPTQKGSERISRYTAIKEKTFCNVVFDFIYLVGQGIYCERFFCRLFGSSHPERIRENFLVLQAKKRRFVISSLICLLVKGIYWKILLLLSLGSSHPEMIRENFQLYCKQREEVL
jgi:hypothetical protein